MNTIITTIAGVIAFFCALFFAFGFCVETQKNGDAKGLALALCVAASVIAVSLLLVRS